VSILEFRELLKIMGASFVLIMVTSSLGRAIYRYIILDGQMTTFDLSWIVSMAQYAIPTSLIWLIFLSRKELSDRQVLIRYAASYIFVVSFVLWRALAFGSDWQQSAGNFWIPLAIFVMTTAIYALVIAIPFLWSSRVSTRLNEALRKSSSRA
jgi:hypothetical protein